MAATKLLIIFFILIILTLLNCPAGLVARFCRLTAIEVFFATQQLENGRNSQQLADFQPKLATITKFLAATRNNYLRSGKNARNQPPGVSTSPKPLLTGFSIHAIRFEGSHHILITFISHFLVFHPPGARGSKILSWLDSPGSHSRNDGSQYRVNL